MSDDDINRINSQLQGVHTDIAGVRKEIIQLSQTVLDKHKITSGIQDQLEAILKLHADLMARVEKIEQILVAHKLAKPK